MTTMTERVAGAGVVTVGWGSWIVSHMAQINSVLQGILLVLSCLATFALWRYHVAKRRNLDRGPSHWGHRR